ncbi:MAG: HPr family phosphocarrier protein [Alsobacter sp.]|jgi:phosphocarrier protein|nr:HPr family phosphocarrier protein [Burkholderiales bacterium]
MIDEEPCPPAPVPDGALVRELRIVNRKGLHARATAKFVQCAEQFEAAIQVTRCGETVGGTSIMGILTLGAGIGTTITVTAVGPDADAAIQALDALVAGRFGEDE